MKPFFTFLDIKLNNIKYEINDAKESKMNLPFKKELNLCRFYFMGT